VQHAGPEQSDPHKWASAYRRLVKSISCIARPPLRQWARFEYTNCGSLSPPFPQLTVVVCVIPLIGLAYFLLPVR